MGEATKGEGSSSLVYALMEQLYGSSRKISTGGNNFYKYFMVMCITCCGCG